MKTADEHFAEMLALSLAGDDEGMLQCAAQHEADKIEMHRRIMAARKSRKADRALLCHNCNMAKGLYGACPHVTSQYRVRVG